MHRSPARRLVSAPLPGNGPGLATWLVGSLGLVTIVALVLFVYGLSPRFPGGGDGGSTMAEGSAGSLRTSPESTDQPEPRSAGNESTARQNARPGDDPLLTSSNGPSVAVPVPDLIGKSAVEATQLVTQRGLLIDDREPVFSEDVPLDAVAEQDPPANAMVPQGSTIVIKLSRGSASVRLADLDLVGLDTGEAEQRLVDHGLGAERVELGDRDVPAGRVVKVDPEGSATVGDTVILYVSVGDRVQVPPEIQGRPVDDVKRQLERAGLDVVATEALDREAIESAGLANLDAAGIDAGDVVGFSVDHGPASFGDWLPRGEDVTLYYFDPTPDDSDTGSS